MKSARISPWGDAARALTRLRTPLLLAAALAASALVQWPALGGDFRHDDFLFFYWAANLSPLDFVLEPHGGHLLMTRNALYLASFLAFGLAPQPYFVVSLLTHLLNTGLLFFVVSRLTGRAVLAAFIAALWGMAPAQQGALNWVTLYGNVVATTFVLCVLAELAHLAASRQHPSALAPVRWGLLVVAAGTSYGTGLAGALACGPVAWLMLPPDCGRTRVAAALGGVGVALIAAYAVVDPKLAGPTLLHFPFAAVVTLFLDLLVYGSASLLLGPLLTTADRGVVLGPLHGLPLVKIVVAAWAVALPAAAGCVWTCWRAVPVRRRQMLGFLVLALGVYGLVALGRAPVIVEHNAHVIEVVRTHHYHYLATVGLAGCLALALRELAERLERGAWWLPRLVPGAVLLWFAVLVAPYAAAARHIGFAMIPWSRRVFDQTRAKLQGQLDAGGPGGELHIPNEDFPAIVFIRPLLGPGDFPGTAAVFVFTHPTDEVNGRRVYFVERDRAVVDAVRARPQTRIARLLLTPEEAAARRAMVQR